MSCPRCGLRLTVAAPFCPRCGAPLTSGINAQPLPPRQPAPGIALTIVITLFFGLFGLIPASIAAGQARDRGHPTGRYWSAFLFTMVGTAAVSVLAVVLFYGAILGLITGAQSAADTAPTTYQTYQDPQVEAEDPETGAATEDSAGESSTPQATFPSGTKQCTSQIGVNEVTSCAFAKKVADAYWTSGGSEVRAYSPVTKKWYTMSCGPEDGVTVCRGGKDAAVYLIP